MRTFVSADELADYMHACNESGLDPITGVLDGNGYVWMTYGEEHTHGGEAMECWVTRGEPVNRHMGHTTCEQCAAPLDARGNLINGDPLESLMYPVILLHDLHEAHRSRRCTACTHRLDSHSGEFTNGIGVCQPQPISEAPLEQCDCRGFRST